MSTVAKLVDLFTTMQTGSLEETVSRLQKIDKRLGHDMPNFGKMLVRLSQSVVELDESMEDLAEAQKSTNTQLLQLHQSMKTLLESLAPSRVRTYKKRKKRSGIQAYWAKMTPGQRKKEMHRRLHLVKKAA